jgi:heme o synthase
MQIAANSLKMAPMIYDPSSIAFEPMRAAGIRAADFIKLTKPKITFVILFTSFIGFCCGAHGPIPLLRLFHTLTGTALAAGGAAALNMYWERKLDSRMKRTELRPLAAGRLKSASALFFAIAIAFGGFVYLFIFVNNLTCCLSALILAGYLFLYTPLKRKTWLCTLIGAVPGALPVVLGWTGANAALSSGAWALFAVVFLWQLPHFYSIGWMYREEYARAGVPVLSVIDASGRRTSRQAIICIILLQGAAIIPFLLGMAGQVYLCGAIILGLMFVAFGFHFARLRNSLAARRLFMFSAFYLPALLLLLFFNSHPAH